MKQIIISLLVFTTFATNTIAQKVYTKNGNISFFSKASLENIQADNNQVMSILNTQTGELQFSVLIKAFHFEKALMEEHFNENYLESGKFPKATFKGNVNDIAKVSFTTDGIYNINVSGEMSIHGVAKKVNATGTITIKAGKITGDSKFLIKLADYGVSIPKLVKDNISETVEVKVACNYDQKM